MIRKHRKKVLITLGALIVVLSIFLVSTYSAAYNFIEVVKSDDSFEENFAIFLEDSPDSGTYSKVNNSWPSLSYYDYELNLEKSYCINGSTMSWNNETKKVTVIMNSADDCYLYFDINKPDVYLTVDLNGISDVTSKGHYNVSTTCSAWDYKSWSLDINPNNYEECNVTFTPKEAVKLNEYITSLATSAPNQGDGKVVNENGYRYQGDNPNNYVWFNEELWRIIGVFETEYATEDKPCNTDSNSDGHFDNCETGSLVKIIRNDSMGGLAWDYDGSSYTNDWSQASLKVLMNEYWFNKGDATDSNYCYGINYSGMKASCDYSGNGLKEEYRDMVVKAKWHLGAADGTGYTASQFYEYERGTRTYTGRPKEYVDYVGLMYVSDYGYAPLVSDCSRGTILSNYFISSYRVGCIGNNWLYGEGYEWYLTPYLSNSYYVFYMYNYGDVTNYNSYYGYGARQSLYLKPNVYVLEGEGSAESPYVVM